MFPGLDTYYADPAQHLITAGQDLDDLDRDLSYLSVRRVKLFPRTVVSVSTVSLDDGFFLAEALSSPLMYRGGLPPEEDGGEFASHTAILQRRFLVLNVITFRDGGGWGGRRELNANVMWSCDIFGLLL